MRSLLLLHLLLLRLLRLLLSLLLLLQRHRSHPPPPKRPPGRTGPRRRVNPSNGRRRNVVRRPCPRPTSLRRHRRESSPSSMAIVDTPPTAQRRWRIPLRQEHRPSPAPMQNLRVEPSPRCKGIGPGCRLPTPRARPRQMTTTCRSRSCPTAWPSPGLAGVGAEAVAASGAGQPGAVAPAGAA